jgi:hypothetical protein
MLILNVKCGVTLTIDASRLAPGASPIIKVTPVRHIRPASGVIAIRLAIDAHPSISILRSDAKCEEKRIR